MFLSFVVGRMYSLYVHGANWKFTIFYCLILTFSDRRIHFFGLTLAVILGGVLWRKRRSERWKKKKMGRRIRVQRKGPGGIFKAHNKHRKGPAKLRSVDYAERHGYIKGWLVGTYMRTPSNSSSLLRRPLLPPSNGPLP